MLRQALSRTQRLAPRAHGAALCSGAAPKLDWATMGFDYLPTRTMVKYNWVRLPLTPRRPAPRAQLTAAPARASQADGKWNAGVMDTDFDVKIHSLSNVLHYGQALFEGLKAFHCKDGKVRTFNSGANVERLRRGCERLQMPTVDQAMFDDALARVIADNVDYVPPYGYGGAMYIRPFVFGHGGKLGLGPAPQYAFCAVASPVGAYYKGGLQAIDALVVEDWDRAAPRGVGSIKAAGNYAPDVLPSSQAKAAGFPVCLYLDAKTNSYIEEFSTSNFIGVTKSGGIVTPSSDSILPSTTKGVLLQVRRAPPNYIRTAL